MDSAGSRPILILTATRLLLFAADEFGFQSSVAGKSGESRLVVVLSCEPTMIREQDIVIFRDTVPPREIRRQMHGGVLPLFLTIHDPLLWFAKSYLSQQKD